MKIGYSRTSPLDQNLDLQLDALKNCGCEKIYQEQISLVKDHRLQLEIVCKRYEQVLHCILDDSTV